MVSQKLINIKIEERLKDVFRPEFLNRVDEIVAFSSLTNEQLIDIVDLMLKDTSSALLDKNITMEVSKEAKITYLKKEQILNLVLDLFVELFKDMLKMKFLREF